MSTGNYNDLTAKVNYPDGKSRQFQSQQYTFGAPIPGHAVCVAPPIGTKGRQGCCSKTITEPGMQVTSQIGQYDDCSQFNMQFIYASLNKI
jgi:hypothetical protein